MFDSTKRNGYSRLFKGVRNRPKGFNFQPRVYDESAERLEKRKEIIQREVERAEKEGKTYRVSDNLRPTVNGMRAQQAKARQVRLIRLGLIIAIILAASKFLLERYSQ